ncbi:MAG TPA: hypothetical protein VEH50_12220 [Methylomirabilota bacterium]|nr:hypothetical protein [Methylomirabilota bacterium]
MGREPTAYEKRMMKLLRLGSPEEVERAMSEPPIQEALEEMQEPYDLYDLEAEDDLIESALNEIEDVGEEGADSIFVTKEGGVALIRVANPEPVEMEMVREYSSPFCRVLRKPPMIGTRGCMWFTFSRIGNLGEFLIYEET